MNTDDSRILPLDRAVILPQTPFTHIPWIRWIERSELPSVLIGCIAFGLFLPFYNFNALPPKLPLQGGIYPPAMALCLLFLLYLARGANHDLGLLIRSGKIEAESLQSLAAGPRGALIELVVGLCLGFQRVYSQISFSHGNSNQLPVTDDMASIGYWVVCISIVVYTVLQIHLLAFCIRQIRVFNRVAANYKIDLLETQQNNIISNPLIRFLLVGLLAFSFGLLLYELIPYSSLQKRILFTAAAGTLVWLVLILFSLIPLFRLKSRVSVAKAQELSCIRRAIKGDADGLIHSQLGERINEFTLPDLMYYEDRVRNIWEWPFEAHIRQFVLFGLIPPLTWILAALVESVFEIFILG